MQKSRVKIKADEQEQAGTKSGEPGEPTELIAEMICQPPITKAEYEALAAFRYAIRRFLHFSEEEAMKIGITPQQQLLLGSERLPWARASHSHRVS